MCEFHGQRDSGWRGWLDLPVQTIVSARGPWVDLSHPLSNAMPRQPFFPHPRFDQFMATPDKPLNITQMEMIVHIGTHVDSPRHVYGDGPAFEDVPLDRLSGAGLVWPVQADQRGLIGPDELEPARQMLQPGDILLLNTGLHHVAGQPDYQRHPSLSVAGAQWLIDQRIKLVGVDTPTPDLPHHKREADFEFPIHRLLLAHGVLIAEHLTGLDALNNQRVEVVCNALNITESDGAPCRILARPIDGQSSVLT